MAHFNSSTLISEVGGLYTKPDGIHLSDDVSKPHNIAISVVFGLAVVTLSVRCIIRLQTSSRLRLDDYLMVIAMIPLTILFALNFVASSYGLGRHIWLTTVGHVETELRMLFISLIIYTIELALIKVAVLQFYRRVFGMNLLNWIAHAFAILWCIGSVIAVLVGPDPIPYFWKGGFYPDSGRWRYEFYDWYIGNAATNVVGDFLVLITPVPIVWGLKMRVAQKVMVSIVLSLGCAVFAASIVRIHYLTREKGEGLIDATWSMSFVTLWSTIEPCLSVISASLPTIQPIVQWALKIEHDIYLKKHMPIKRTRASILGLRRSDDTLGTSGGRETPMRAVNKSEEDVIRLFTHAAHVEADTAPSNSSQRRATNNLEEYLGTSYIRVQHDVTVSYD